MDNDDYLIFVFLTVLVFLIGVLLGDLLFKVLVKVMQ